MKQITAIIRMNMMNVTKQALIEAGFPAFTVRKVLGRGKGNVDYRVISGAEAGAITQDPIGIGYKAVEAAVKAIRGQPVPKNIDTGFHWFDKTNIDDPAIAAVLYN